MPSAAGHARLRPSHCQACVQELMVIQEYGRRPFQVIRIKAKYRWILHDADAWCTWHITWCKMHGAHGTSVHQLARPAHSQHPFYITKEIAPFRLKGDSRVLLICKWLSPAPPVHLMQQPKEIFASSLEWIRRRKSSVMLISDSCSSQEWSAMISKIHGPRGWIRIPCVVAGWYGHRGIHRRLAHVAAETCSGGIRNGHPPRKHVEVAQRPGGIAQWQLTLRPRKHEPCRLPCLVRPPAMKAIGWQLLTSCAANEKLSQQRALTEGGLEFKATNQCSDFLNHFKKSPDVYCGHCKCLL